MADHATVWVDPDDPAAGARVAVHHLFDAPGATPLLVSHATGFHARCYRQMAAALGGDYDVWGIDHRGHGATPLPAGWAVDWRGYGVDTLAVARHLAEAAGAPLVGFGHSMGGATLLMAAAAAPELFVALVLFEPISFPPRALPDDPEDFPLVKGARRRRARFDSIEAAFENYASKPPLSAIDRRVLRDYVEFGFRPADPPPGVELCCTPDHEGNTFAASRGNGVWDLLPGVRVPVVVIASSDGGGPAVMAPSVAERIPGGRAVVAPGQTHFGPFSHPGEVAALLRQHAGAGDSRPV